MYSFVAGAGLGGEAQRRGSSLGQLLEHAARQVASQAPDLGTPLGIDCVEIPEIAGGWALIAPATGARPPLLSQYRDAEHAVLVFGQVFASGDAARCVRELFVAGGLERVGEVAGVFSALVVELRTGRLHVFTSTPGWRSLRYRSHAGALSLAPTDLGVVALSRCVVRPDFGALATILGCGWPLGGGAALEGVGECQSHERWTWSDGRFVMTGNAIQRRQKIQHADATAISKQIDHVVHELVAGAKHQLAHYTNQTISVPLTAGMDSRAVLALLYPLVEPGRLTTYTRGAESQDMRVAGMLARRLGIPHEKKTTDLPSVEAFADNARFLATFTNGVSSADVAVGPAFKVEQRTPTPLGHGPEVFRGLYYKYLWRSPRHSKGAARVSAALLAGPLQRLRALRFSDAALDSEPIRRLDSTLTALEEYSEDEHDLADLFFLFERMGRWEATVWRRCLGPALVPFANHRAIMAAFELPGPLGYHAILPTIINRYIPRAYWTPVNGTGLLALEGPGLGRFAAREALRVSAKLARETRQRWLPKERAPRDTRLAFLRGTPFEMVQDTLRSSHSLSRVLFSPKQLEQMLDTKARRRDEALPGALLSLELWKLALDQAASST